MTTQVSDASCIAPPLPGIALYPESMTSFDWHTASADEVDSQYSPSKFALRPLSEYFAEYRARSESFAPEHLVRPQQPLLIYIHGGYWQALSANDSRFNAADAQRLEISLHAVEYTLAPYASVEQIVHECLVDVAHVIQQLDPSCVVLAGSSAGAHLAAMCARDAVIAPLLDGVALLSGVYDVRPLVVTPTNDALHLDENTAARVSPQLLNSSSQLRQALLAVGQHESTEFIRQNAEYADHLAQVGTRTVCEVVANRDHFDLPYDLLSAGTTVGDWVLNILKGESHVA
jgi:arylformamidase